MSRVFWKKSKTKKWYVAVCKANSIRRGQHQSSEHVKNRVSGWKKNWKQRTVHQKKSFSERIRQVVTKHWASLSDKERKARAPRHSIKTKLQMSKKRKAHWLDKQARSQHELALRKRSKDPEYLKKLHAATRDNPDWVRAKYKNTKPTKPEEELDSILEEAFPNEFFLNVNGDFSLFGRVPDFVNVNGKKVLVELFGRFWHAKQEEKLRKKLFSKFGFKTAIIWDNELDDIEKVVAKVKKIM